MEHGAKVNIRNWNGVTALGVAAMSGQEEIVEMLLEAGAEVNTRDNEGNTVILNIITQVSNTKYRVSRKN